MEFDEALAVAVHKYNPSLTLREKQVGMYTFVCYHKPSIM